MIDIFKIIFKRELKICLRNKGEIIANLLYFIIFLSIFQIIIQNLSLKIEANFFIIATILAIFLSIICFNNNFLSLDNKDGTLEQIIIHCENIEFYIIAKSLARWVSSCFLIILCACLMLPIINLEILNFWKLFLILALSSLSLNFLLAMCGSLSIVGGVSSLIAVLAMPLALPILILTAITIDNFQQNILPLMALTFLIISLSSLASAKIIKIANS